MVKQNLSRLKINSVVKAIILAEMLVWSGWNFIMPIFSIYVAKLPNGSVEKAASSFSVYLIVRVVFGLASGKYLTHKRTRHKLFLMVVGMTILSISYFGLAFVNDMQQIYFFYGLIGLALGIASPAKNALFSTSVNQKNASLTWSILDAGVFLSMAVAAVIAGSVVGKFGFRSLFFLAAFVNMTGIVPYMIYVRYWSKTSSISLQKSFSRLMM